jgi:predicted phage terminase large subunit-like protein
MLPMEYDPARSMPTRLGWQDWRTEEGELLFPERFPAEVVARDKAVMGPYAVAGQFQQTPTPRGGGIIQRDWWQLWEGQGVFPGCDFIIASLDCAYTEKSENDYSACTVWGVFTDDGRALAANIISPDGRYAQNGRTYVEGAPKLILMHAWQERLELHALVQKVAATAKKYKIDHLVIEAKASGHSLAQEMRRLFGHEDFAVRLYNPKAQDKVSRLYSVQHIFAEGMVYAPDMTWAEMVMTQCAQFPKGKHDDLVDSLSQGVRYLREMGLLVRAPERLNEIEESRRYKGPPPAPLYPV